MTVDTSPCTDDAGDLSDGDRADDSAGEHLDGPSVVTDPRALFWPLRGRRWREGLKVGLVLALLVSLAGTALLAGGGAAQPRRADPSEVQLLPGGPVIHPRQHKIGPIPKEYDDMKVHSAYITSAAYPYKCLNILGRPHNGKRIEIWDCPSTESLVTKFLVPADGRGPIRPVEAPDLCVESPEKNRLQLWSCKDVIEKRGPKVLEWVLNHESSSWLRCAHYDLPDKQDVEQMSADDLDKVMHHVEQAGYAGFSIWKGTAWIKGVKELSKDDLHYMGVKDPVVFYLHRPHDFTLHTAEDMSHCMGVPGKFPHNGLHVHLFECGANNVYELVEETRFTLHYTDMPTTTHTTTTITTTTATLTTITMLGPTTVTTTMTLPPPPPEVKVSMILTSIDYPAFHRDRQLVAEVVKVIKESVAEAAGHGITTRDVGASLSPGSVRVASVVNVPDGVSQDDLKSSLESSDLKKKIASRVAALPGIDQVSTGEVGAEEDEQAIPWGPILKWFGIVAGTLTLCCCLAAACTIGSKRIRAKTSALSNYKTREPVVNIDNPGVWRLGRIQDRSRADQATFDIDLDSSGGGRPALLAVGYSPVNGGSSAGTPSNI